MLASLRVGRRVARVWWVCDRHHVMAQQRQSALKEDYGLEFDVFHSKEKKSKFLKSFWRNLPSWSRTESWPAEWLGRPVSLHTLIPTILQVAGVLPAYYSEPLAQDYLDSRLLTDSKK